MTEQIAPFDAKEAGKAAVRAFDAQNPKPAEPTAPQFTRPRIICGNYDSHRLWLEVEPHRGHYNEPSIVLCQTGERPRSNIGIEELRALQEEISRAIADYEHAAEDRQDYLAYERALHRWEERRADVKQAAMLKWREQHGEEISPYDKDDEEDDD